MLNRQERVALLLLSGALLVGTAASVVDYYDPSRLVEFSVLRGAVPVPAPLSPDDVAARLADGELLSGELGERVEPTGHAHQMAAVAINSATARELERLPAIGPKTAARIVQYRDTHGPFVSVEALQNVIGIGPRTLDKLRPVAVLELDRRRDSPPQKDE